VNLEPLDAERRWPSSDDELLAHLLIHTWMLITGRMLRSDIPPQDLTEQELIEFWADMGITAGRCYGWQGFAWESGSVMG
jgi:hypothetical protein